jgi:hypothetical protein
MDGQKGRFGNRQEMLVLPESRYFNGHRRFVPWWPPEKDVLLRPHAIVGAKAAASGVVCAAAYDRLCARAACPVEFAVNEDV